ncbi:MAG: single-stranded-DNA-specific exonuclease RecJ, single-stranded-DNA-specific exonuclease [Candidatus Peregrinibacteria bacterium GW2011_GWE2_39_6]|nr:MAG: single-stranded-DNA-specific exonuclease RecJ, single-stranded-DNA-specific exonuclease [Candidatus Peregrinibacteria bacterium GW2011_GWF2_39_17]KKR26031.1 MAG: single-stranded-DNA-specific exonuclease RecJ, single-stranded-DNA-specific exonuclease [Candidatus Peregrinibacteria bacterium GW2011_GWE2_39_6]HCW32042.1 single-stranded-DNA-specific exonuclease RecJ [Candidatus Peregrinibacteria bacterium]
MSLLGQKWALKYPDLTSLLNKNLDDQTVIFHDPFLMPDMQKATERLKKAIKQQERILIFGDYDVDGISGTAIMIHTLRALNANVSYRLPNRQQGYSLNQKWIDEFTNLGIKILITVDCGISNYKEIKKATLSGMEVIVTDHHTFPKQMPTDAYAILHPRYPKETYPFNDLSGSGVALKLAVGLMRTIHSEKEANEWLQALVDLASLGTVTDCVSLLGENRWIVKNGLTQMRQTKWEGLRLLLQSAGVLDIQGYDTDIIGFRIGPRLNASGRLETPYFALQLLLNENGMAHRFATKLESLNSARQVVVEKAIEEAEAKLQAVDFLEQKIIILSDENWSAGIIGLIASKLSERYARPAIIMEDRGEELVGSCRSSSNFNVIEALQAHEALLLTYGGHAGAAGFSISKKNLGKLKKALEDHAQKCIPNEELTPTLSIDYQVLAPQISFKLVDHLNKLAPYGTNNPKPRFLLSNANPTQLQTVGREHRHLKFYIPLKRDSISAIAFRFGEYQATLQEAIENNQAVDVVFELGKSTWNGRERLEMRVVDMGIAKE